MKILVSCYACSPYGGSELAMGWNFLKILSHKHEMHIITESKFEPDLERYFSECPDEKQYYNFYFIKKIRHKKLRKIWPPSYYWFYNDWQKKAYKKALELESIHHFNLVHQLNMVGFRECGYLWKLNKPLVWGPTAGMHLSPWKLLPYIGVYGMFYYGMRNILNLKDIHFKKNPRRMATHSNAIITATQDAHDTIKKVWGYESTIIPEVGMLEVPTIDIKIKRIDSMKIAWSGNHTPSKALNFLIEAIAESRHKDKIELHVLGIGMYTNRWKKLATKLNVMNIIWHGWVDRSIAINTMKACDVFCITSMADLTSTVLLEALSYGKPVIAMNNFGFANTITNECGIKVEIHSKKQVVKDYAKAIDFIFENPDERERLSIGALKRAHDFEWSEKGKVLEKIYAQALKNFRKKHGL